MSAIESLIAAAVGANATPEQLAAIVAAFNGTSLATEPVAEVSTNPGPPSLPARKVDGRTKAGRAAKAAKTAPVKIRTYTWKRWAIDKHSIPTTCGAAFSYPGKNGTTNHIVTAYADDVVSSVLA
jgi:hypothetical protein